MQKVSWMVAAVLMGSSWGFSLKPEETQVDGKLRSLESSVITRWLDLTAARVIDHFTHPVHESLTHRMYGCQQEGEACGKQPVSLRAAPAAVIAGVRWNDNPPFELESSHMADCVGKTIKLPSYSKCWVYLFKDAEKRARKQVIDDEYVLLYRVHFGDMQFLHSMASRDQEPPAVTQQRILMWAEFTYRLAVGELTQDLELRRIAIPGMEVVFKRRGWTAQQLFTRGDPTFRPKAQFQQFAFGSLLHMVEDSFAKGHVDRDEATGRTCPGTFLPEPGRIKRFHAYGGQDHQAHADADTAEAAEAHLVVADPNVIQIGTHLRQLVEQGVPWVDAKPYLSCVFALHDEVGPSGPGVQFQMGK
ncbi:hypothetical protein [Chitinimonas sp. BJYL2]|uniref:hypothetical protein n=1 Tax=Chitinimonas sp. BJYL2 TaxID=2976696 RepID=UPI0022B48A06|nr:hypothetical protein [Chitinimonas sp. BJYL2]